MSEYKIPGFLIQLLPHLSNSDKDNARKYINSIIRLENLNVESITEHILKFQKYIWFMCLNAGRYKQLTRGYPYYWKIPRLVRLWSKNINTIKDFINNETSLFFSYYFDCK